MRPLKINSVAVWCNHEFLFDVSRIKLLNLKVDDNVFTGGPVEI
jgi:hypothetical protein